MSTETTEPAEQAQPVFASLEDWVTERFLPMYRRTLGGEYRWCAEWWRHAEAISRLTTLWHLWETLRLKAGSGMAEWYVHLDHHLPILLGARGPFYQCSQTEHLEPHPARAVPAPPWWWAGLVSPQTADAHVGT